jgi:chromosome segregation ATPase
MLRTTAATLGQVQADRDKLSAKESSIIQREAEISRREATINERDKEIEQRLASAVNEAEQEKKAREIADAHVARVQAAQDNVLRLQEEAQTQRDRLNDMMRRIDSEEARTRIQPEERDIGRLMNMFPGTYALGNLLYRSFIELHNGERIE